MRIGSLFAGIGGLELGLEWAGVGETVWQVEQNPYCLSILAKHWPNAERFTDVREVGAANLTPIDLICGGFPCQDVSTAGRGAGLAGARSGLWYEYARIVAELRPRFVVVENVASGAARWVDAVRSDLERIGYETLPIPISAADLGAPHRRARIFLLGVTADCHSERGRPGWSRGPAGRDAGSTDETPSGVLTDCDSKQQLRHESRRWSCNSDRFWAVEPDVARVVHGIPGRVDREKALGNSVVPQCAEVVGHVIRKLCEAACPHE